MLQRHVAFEAQLGGGAFKSRDRDRVIERIVQPAQMRRLRRDRQLGADQAQIVALARTEHHAMFAETDWFTIAINGGVAHREKRHQAAVPESGRRDLIGPDPEALQCTRTERGGDCDIGGVAAARHQNAAHTRHVVAADRKCASGRRSRPRTTRRNRPADTAAASQHLPDIRCSSAREYSCSGRKRWPDARNHGKRRSARCKPPRRFACCARILIIESRYGYGRNRRWPARAGTRRRAAEQLPGRLQTAGRFRNSGCPTGTEEYVREVLPRVPVARQSALRRHRYPEQSRRWSAEAGRGGASNRLQRFPKGIDVGIYRNCRFREKVIGNHDVARSGIVDIDDEN